MNPRQMHFINILVVAYGRIDGKQSNKNSQLWFYKMFRFFECWKIPSNQPAKAFYKYQSGYSFLHDRSCRFRIVNLIAASCYSSQRRDAMGRHNGQNTMGRKQPENGKCHIYGGQIGESCLCNISKIQNCGYVCNSSICFTFFFQKTSLYIHKLCPQSILKHSVVHFKIYLVKSILFIQL